MAVADERVGEVGSGAEARWDVLRVVESGLVLAVLVYCLGPWRWELPDVTVFGLSGLAIAMFPRRLLPAPARVRRAPGAEGGLLAFTLLGLVLISLYGARAGVEPHPGHVLAVFVLYLPFAWLQQYGMQRYLLRRHLRRVAPRSRALTALIAGIVFALLHLPFPILIAPTLIAGSVWSYSYIRTGRLWPNTLSHALLATSLFFAVVQKDPFRHLNASLGWFG